MCTIVTGVGPEDIELVGDLKARWTVLPDDLDPDTSDDECLCGVNVEAVLTRAGVQYEWDPFGWRVIAEGGEQVRSPNES